MIAAIIDDVPFEVEVQIKRQEFLVSKVILDTPDEESDIAGAEEADENQVRPPVRPSVRPFVRSLARSLARPYSSLSLFSSRPRRGATSPRSRAGRRCRTVRLTSSASDGPSASRARGRPSFPQIVYNTAKGHMPDLIVLGNDTDFLPRTPYDGQKQ